MTPSAVAGSQFKLIASTPLDEQVLGDAAVLGRALDGERATKTKERPAAGVKFVAPAGTQRSKVRSAASQKRIEHHIGTTDTGDDQVLIEWCLEKSRIRSAKYCIGLLDVVRDPHARFRFLMRCKSVIEVSTQAKI